VQLGLKDGRNGLDPGAARRLAADSPEPGLDRRGGQVFDEYSALPSAVSSSISPSLSAASSIARLPAPLIASTCSCRPPRPT